MNSGKKTRRIASQGDNYVDLISNSSITSIIDLKYSLSSFDSF